MYKKKRILRLLRVDLISHLVLYPFLIFFHTPPNLNSLTHFYDIRHTREYTDGGHSRLNRTIPILWQNKVQSLSKVILYPGILLFLFPLCKSPSSSCWASFFGELSAGVRRCTVRWAPRRKHVRGISPPLPIRRVPQKPRRDCAGLARCGVLGEECSRSTEMKGI